MYRISPSESPSGSGLYWTTVVGENIRHSGFTELGLETVGPSGFMFSEREDGYLQSVNTVVNDLYSLPVSGWLEKGEIYDYNGVAVLVRQSHERTEHDPSTIPALFSIYREDTGDLEWAANEYVCIDATRTYSAIVYICIQSHTTQVGWEPPNVPALWLVVSGDVWQAGVLYNVDDIVTYNDIEYICIQSHTSQAGWEPPNVPALWSVN